MIRKFSVILLVALAACGRLKGPSGGIEPIEAPPLTGIDAVSAAGVNAIPSNDELKSEEGSAVVRAQILLDRARFSVGTINGRAMKNTALAIHWFQKSQGLPATSMLDSVTYSRLAAVSGPVPPVIRLVVDAEMIAGPFMEMPRDVYEQAKLSCLCYASVSEKIAEHFHSSIEMMRKLNPGVGFAALKPGDSIWAPALEPVTAAKAIKRIQISKKGNYVHAFAADGSLVFHFPSTLGSRYDPSPTGKFRVTGVAWDPVFRYDPTLFSDVPDHKPVRDFPQDRTRLSARCGLRCRRST